MIKKLYVAHTPAFNRQFRTLDELIQEEAIEKIELFKNIENHKQLKVHKLKGPLSGRYSFSVNYKFRIIFTYLSKKEAVLMAIGDHEIYK